MVCVCGLGWVGWVEGVRGLGGERVGDQESRLASCVEMEKNVALA